MRYLMLFVALILLAGCAATEAPTATPPPPAPTVAPTAVSLDNIDLESVLIQTGDLPAGIEPAQVLDTAPPAYTSMKVPGADKVIFERFQRGGQPAGYVVVSIYKDEKVRKDAFGLVAEDLRVAASIGGDQVKEPAGIGEQSVIVATKPPLEGAHLVFSHCRAVISAFLSGNLIGEEEISAYGKRLDKRLRTVVC